MTAHLTRTAASEGAPDWRLFGDRLLSLCVKTRTFVEAIDFVRAVADIAEEQQHHPDIDIRYNRVFLTVTSHDVGALTDRDLRFANAVAVLVQERGHTLSPKPLTLVEVGIDCADPQRIAPFWAAILGGKTDGFEVADPHSRSPFVWFQQTDSPDEHRGRTHLDVNVAHDLFDDRVRAALDAGGTVVDDSHLPMFIVLGDPDGNVACVCSWHGRDEVEQAAEAAQGEAEHDADADDDATAG
ncbi:MAG: 4a-hydroxytetrahydrobiopterin dehydratase [Pseudoclavibacter sp.]